MPDPQWGEALKAVIVLKPGAKMQSGELLSYCKERLSAYKVPKSVEFRDSLPHTEVGKVNKVKLKEIILAEAATVSLIHRLAPMEPRCGKKHVILHPARAHQRPQRTGCR